MGLDGNGVVNGVGGAIFRATEEGVEVEDLIVGMGEGGGIWVGIKPFVGQDGGDDAGSAGDGGGEAACAEGGTIDEEVKLVGGVAAIVTAVEGDRKNSVLDLGIGNCNHWYGTFADDDAREIDKAVGGEAVFVEVLEEGVGAVMLSDGQPMETDKMCFFHV